MENVTILVALGAGIASFLSPCILPLVPVYLASLAGPRIFERKASDPTRWPLFFHSLSFVLGFAIVFTGLGALAGLTGIIVNPNSLIIRFLSGGILVVFGLFMLLALKIPTLNYEKRLSLPISTKTGYARSFLMGAVFTLAWVPCVSPILGSILSLAIGSDTVWQGASLLLVYSLGLGIPFLLLGLAFESVLPTIKRIGRYSGVIYIISGILLVVVGILVLTGNISFFATLG